MQTNWNIILNVLLLLGVIMSIRRLVKARGQRLNPINYQPLIETAKEDRNPSLGDDIIAVRRVNPGLEPEKSSVSNATMSIGDQDQHTPKSEEKKVDVKKVDIESPKKSPEAENLTLINDCPVLTMFLLAKENRQLVGYDLLQSLLSVGLCFGQGSLFHRHQSPEGQGPILCSVAAATPSGTFDLQNIGALSIKGLCLFMPVSNNSTIDTGRFTILYQIATQLRDCLDAMLLDDQRKRLTQGSFNRYAEMLSNPEIRDLYTRSPYF